MHVSQGFATCGVQQPCDSYVETLHCSSAVCRDCVKCQAACPSWCTSHSTACMGLPLGLLFASQQGQCPGGSISFEDKASSQQPLAMT